MIEFLLGAAVSAALYYACYMAGRERGRDKGYNAAGGTGTHGTTGRSRKRPKATSVCGTP